MTARFHGRIRTNAPAHTLACFAPHLHASRYSSSACGKKKTRVCGATFRVPRARIPAAPSAPIGSTERGIASWYGKPYDGRQAADGEIYDMEQMVAAHRTLPFQTMVRVRNLTNDKTVDVRIIDRGPFVANRIIDLSHAAARAIDLIGPGVANVEITIISNTAPTAANAPVAVSTPAVILADDNARFRRSGRRLPGPRANADPACSNKWPALM